MKIRKLLLDIQYSKIYQIIKWKIEWICFKLFGNPTHSFCELCGDINDRTHCNTSRCVNCEALKEIKDNKTIDIINVDNLVKIPNIVDVKVIENEGK